MKNLFSFFVFAFVCQAVVAHASSLPETGDAPIEITASQSLIWDRQAHQYTAEGDARAVQGALDVQADRLRAGYAEGASATAIETLVAEGQVTILYPPYTAKGDRAAYNVQSGEALLTGTGLAIFTAQDKLTARDSIGFSTQSNKMTAIGNAVVTRTTPQGQDTLSADRMDAYFMDDAGGNKALKNVIAEGHVSVRTAKETVTGAHGTYDTVAQKAIISGDVVIRQNDGSGTLTGTRAETDLKTGISKLFAAPKSATDNTSRVRGVFYPKKTDKTGAP